MSPNEFPGNSAEQKYIQIELLNQELEQLMSQREFVSMKAGELSILRDSVLKVEAGEGFAQLGEGVYVPAIFKDTDRVLMDIGRNLFVKMKKEDAKGFLLEKSEAFTQALAKMDGRIEDLSMQMQKIAMELQGNK
jgi:prefoldin alpha subunit